MKQAFQSGATRLASNGLAPGKEATAGVEGYAVAPDAVAPYRVPRPGRSRKGNLGGPALGRPLRTSSGVDNLLTTVIEKFW